MTNGDLAQHARDVAAEAIKTRRAALVVAVCLDESATLDGARRLISDLTDTLLAAAALAVLDELAQLEGSQP